MAKMKKKLLSTNAAASIAREKLLAAAKTDARTLLDEYGNTETGFSDELAEEMRDRYGANVVTQQKKETLFKRIVKSFLNPFTVILLALAVISLFTDVIFAGAFGAEPDITAVVIVLVMVTVSGVLRFVQETRSNTAAEKLKAMINTTTCVLRGGERREVPLAEVVTGDIICLSAGDMIPADVRILSSKDLFVSESSLTGESNPVEKIGAAQTFKHKNATGLPNLAFMGSNVVSGSANCMAVCIGDNTHFGTLARSLTEKRDPTSFEKGVNSVSWVLIRFMLVMVPVVFFANGFFKGVIAGGGGRSWVDALMFGLAVAVGLTPEMLPMIVTAGLAKGAYQMARKKTVVKNLNSIQNFGAIDVLCTDKTGTLTQDEIALEKYLDIHGQSDARVLRHAFLNSYFQTGMKNVMDKAIIKHIHDRGMAELSQRYVKVDEIPFDFARRRMSVVIKDNAGKTQLITKGAVEEMLSICTHAEYKGQIPVLTDEIKQEIMATVEELNGEGLRVLAIAQKNNPSPEGVFSVKDEAQMVLIGYLAFLDPPKASAKAAIAALAEHGVAVKILTGDNAEVTKCIARKVGMKFDRIFLGSEIAMMDDAQLSQAVETTNIFAKLDPQQKSRIVKMLRQNGHAVGFMGDGINDAAAIRDADVGISVDNAVDIAKESADIILLEKDLMILEKGIVEGRKTFANIIKYIKMTASSNFGNMFSVLVASALLPFLPMLPIQILGLNLIYDLSCVSVPWDNVDRGYLKEPKKWDASSISKFMLWIGPTSSVFDVTTYMLMFWVICPNVCGGRYKTLDADAQAKFRALFQAGWFVESLWSQTLVIHMIRTPKVPFFQSRASFPVLGTTCAAIALGTALPFTPIGTLFGMSALPWAYFPWLAGTIVAYTALVTVVKKVYVRRYGELL
ncbi:MAG: magnesium-translocating P-type ATPase [Firmicutes bacterium]|nr:magnesium-translocating P-type ATPase [Bacillota bacterium]